MPSTNATDGDGQRTITVISRNGNSTYIDLTKYFSEKTSQKKPTGDGA